MGNNKVTATISVCRGESVSSNMTSNTTTTEVTSTSQQRSIQQGLLVKSYGELFKKQSTFHRDALKDVLNGMPDILRTAVLFADKTQKTRSVPAVLSEAEWVEQSMDNPVNALKHVMVTLKSNEEVRGQLTRFGYDELTNDIESMRRIAVYFYLVEDYNPNAFYAS
jgi:hypothetical protein